jgi:hypothetical protein
MPRPKLNIPKVRMNITMTNERRKQLEELCRVYGLSMSDTISLLIDGAHTHETTAH